MHGITALGIFAGFLLVAAVFLSAVYASWRDRRKTDRSTLRLVGLTLLVSVWFLGISSTYVREASFWYRVSKLEATEVSSVQIGKHNFRDREAISKIVSALRGSRWFEVNHGGWGDSVPLTIHRYSGPDTVLDIALYFRESAAIVSPGNLKGSHYAPSHLFAPDLPSALSAHGVTLPKCDSDHGRPCTLEQLNP